MKSLFALCLLFLMPQLAVAAEPEEQPPTASSTNTTMPDHEYKKLHPEFSDPVLGDRAAVIEWSWSPQYAKRFNLPVQSDGLPDGALWLVGVKIERQQYRDWQSYACRIVGLIDNKLPILTPPGDRYVIHPGDQWEGGLPGKAQTGSTDLAFEVHGMGEQTKFLPGQLAWCKKPRNKAERDKPETGIGTPYIFYHRSYTPDLAYFELDGGCAHFSDPEQFRNELRFPTQLVGKKDEPMFEASAAKFDIPDSLMRKIYPYTRDAYDWRTCLMRRIGGKSFTLSLEALKSKRFGDTCEPITDAEIYR